MILGPPGTGKTYTLMRELERLRSEGYELSEIAFVSFTRRAMAEARERARKTFDLDMDPPWFKTMHSAFWHRLGLRDGVKITRKDWADFAETAHYDITAGDDVGPSMEEGFTAPKSGSPDDELMRASDWARCRMVGAAEAAAALGVHVKRLETFMVRYRRWKNANGKMDFTDVLEEAVRRGSRLPATVLVVDEAQDLNPLQIAALKPTLAAVEQAIVAGDDDQAIFTFAGAEPEWLIGLATDTEWSTRVLSQSYRVPRAVHRVAQAIISPNKRRVAKRYQARDEDGVVFHGAESLSRVVAEHHARHGGTSAILARTNRSLRPHIRELFAGREVPYLVSRGGGPNPLGATKVCGAIATAAKIVDGEDVTRDELLKMLAYVPSRPAGLYLAHGTKAKVGRWPDWRVTPDDIEELQLDGLRARGRDLGHVEMLMALKPELRAWHAAMWARHGKVPDPVCTVSTIHGVKGAEFDLVCIDPSHPRIVEQDLNTPDGRESEARVAYVGVTRAKTRLVVGIQRGRFGYRYP